MALGILGRKLGMTRIFNGEGKPIPVTVIEAGPCPVISQKSDVKPGYVYFQVGFEPVAKLNKPLSGHLKKHGLENGLRHLHEFAVAEKDSGALADVKEIKVGIFAENERVVVSGLSIGKGFQGVVKRHNFKGGPATHGSMSHRAPGSIGGSNPDRVPKGRRMGGRMGGKRITVRNLQVVRVDADRNLLLLKGAVPGAENSLLEIRKIVKGSK